MSAFIAVRHSDSFHLLNDGGVFAGDDMLAADVSKIIILAHLNAVIGIQGPLQLHAALSLSIQGAPSYDGLKIALPGLFTDAVFALEAQAPMVNRARVIVGGISESSGIDSYALSARPGDISDFAFEAMQCDWIAAVPGEGVESVSKRYPEIRQPDDWDPRKHGVEMMEAQIAAGGFAGRYCQWTSVLPWGINTRILRRWQ